MTSAWQSNPKRGAVVSKTMLTESDERVIYCGPDVHHNGRFRITERNGLTENSVSLTRAELRQVIRSARPALEKAGKP